MSTQPTAQINTFTIHEKKNQSIDIKGIINKYLYHWPLFLICLAIALTAAYFYLKGAKPVYEIKATLLIKDEKKTPDQRAALQEINLANTSKIVESEVEVIKSKQVISQVVQDLRLWIGYQKKNGFNYDDLYKSGPVNLVSFTPGIAASTGAVSIIIKDKNSFLIKRSDGTLTPFYFKNGLKTDFGTLKLEPTANLEQFKGATIKVSIADPDQVALMYQGAIGASITNKLSTAVNISLEDANPQRGKDIVNRLIYNYNLAGIKEKNRETKSTVDFIDERLASLSGELNQAERGIENFKSSRGLTDISSDSKISLENMQANDTRLNDVNVQLGVIENVERYVNSPRNAGKAPATVGITDPALSTLTEKLVGLQLQREQLLATTPETNPDFEPINRQIAVTKSAIKENIRNIKSSLQSTHQQLQSINNRFESNIKDIPTQERQYISIKRQQAIKESLYTYLLQKREEVSVNYATTLADDRIVDQAYAGPARMQKKPLAYAAAFLLGLGLPIGLIYTRGRLSNKITNLHEIKEAVELPVIGELPLESSDNPIAINDFSATPTSEQFRALRIKLYHLLGEKEYGRITMVTSSIPGEGKSFVSSNLGAVLAYSGRKTVILELDLRKPKIAQTFNLTKPHVGMSDYLNGTATREDIIQNTGIDPKLDVISSGDMVKNPTELLERKELKDLIESLRYVYDDIIIDTPPVHLVPDAFVLSKLADITLYIIKQGFTDKAELNFINELSHQQSLSNVHLIFNGIERVKYGYGYNYNNTYYNTEKSNGLSYLFSNFSSRF